MSISSVLKTLVLAFLLLNLESDGYPAEPAQRSLPPVPEPLRSVIEFAQQNQISLATIDRPQDRPAQPGDLAVLLVTLFEGSALKQWLIELSVVEPNSKELLAKRPPTVCYSTTGARLEYAYSPLAFELKTHGPFLVNSTPKAVHTTTARTVVNGDDLALGFDTACRAFLAIGEAKARSTNPRPFGMGFQPNPPSKEVVAETKPRAEELGITPADERSIAGCIPALVGFFGIAQATSGLREIVWEIIDLPSAWSVMKRGGRVDTNFNLDGNIMGKMETPPNEPQRYVFAVDLQLNGQSALKAKMVVVEPKPPLLTTAGILTIYAEHPTKPDRHAVIQVLATRLGKDAP